MKTSLLFTKKDIEIKVAELAEQINKHYGTEDILVIGILKGAFIFYSDLVKLLTPVVTCDFCSVSYYGDSLKAASEAVIEMDVTQRIKGKNILLVDTIIDNGRTIEFVKNHLQQRHPKSIKSVALVTKPEGRKKINPDFSGFEVEQDSFIIGYGIDYQNKGRSLDHFVQLDTIN